MIRRIKGAGSLSRKLTAILVLSAMATLGYAADNSIYIDQAGDSSTISIMQDGSGNRVRGINLNGTAGGNTDPAKLTGNAQTINIDQLGSANQLSIGATTSQGGSVAGNTNIGINLNYQVIGSSNIGYININNNTQATAGTKGNVIDIQQTGSGNDMSLSMTGSSNQLTIGTSGDSNTFLGNINASDTVTSLSETGNGNNTTLTMSGDKGQVGITLNGASNTTNINQSASGAAGAQIILDIAGSSNTTNITQSGSKDHYANIKINSTQAGSDLNSITLTQSGGSSAGQSATIDLTGASNTIGITQQGTLDNLTNLKISGNSNTYTILQKN